MIGRRHHKGHVARTGPRQHVHHPVGRTGDHRRLHVVHRHRESARGAVAVGIGRRAGHRRRPHRKTAAAGRHAHHAHLRTIIRRRHHKGHVARTGPPQHVRHTVVRTGYNPRVHAVHRHRETARGAVAVRIGRRAGHRRRPHRKTAAAGRHTHHAHPRTTTRRPHLPYTTLFRSPRQHVHHPVG